MKKWTVAAIRAAKGNTKLGCATAYDYTFARLADAAGVPLLLVGDSLGMTMLGYANTLNVTLDDVTRAVSAVSRGAENACVIADMPFGTYQVNADEAVRNAVRCLQAGADGVKLEGGTTVAPLVRRLVSAGIPVFAHVGMTPQSVNEYGGFKMQGKTREAADAIFEDAQAVAAAGAFAVTLECIPDELAARITASVACPTVGIGAGPVCDGQFLVMHDLLGLNTGHVPSFCRKFAELGALSVEAFSQYVRSVADGSFPPPRTKCNNT